jgi:hypothetical protein
VSGSLEVMLRDLVDLGVDPELHFGRSKRHPVDSNWCCHDQQNTDWHCHGEGENGASEAVEGLLNMKRRQANADPQD